MANNYTEAQKVELGFTLNSFNKPQEYSGKEAWTRQILDLMLYEPGTFQSDENIGCGITRETFRNPDYIENTIVPKLNTMVETYLPDIPFEGLSVTIPDDQIDVAIYFFSFSTTADGMEFVTVAVKQDSNMIDYTILT